MKVDIDKYAGFCFGVINAVKKVENELNEWGNAYCLGEIVHNQVEKERLEAIGLKTISHEQLKTIKNTRVLIRAHGEPPSTYQLATQNKIEIIDGTCPIVKKLQNKIKDFHKQNPEYQVVIYGKKGHAEVLGLQGQVTKSIVVQTEDDLQQINFNKAVYLVSQTTMSREGFKHISELIASQLIAKHSNIESQLICNNSVCGQVANRKPKIQQFAQTHDCIVFVAGKNSSNGQQLFKACQQANQNTCFISNVDELDKAWLKNFETIGITGATSTPAWLLHKTKERIKQLL